MAWPPRTNGFGSLRRLDLALSGALIGFLAGIGGSPEQKPKILMQRARQARIKFSPTESRYGTLWVSKDPKNARL